MNGGALDKKQFTGIINIKAAGASCKTKKLAFFGKIFYN
jgi:hypothetical protein